MDRVDPPAKTTLIHRQPPTSAVDPLQTFTISSNLEPTGGRDGMPTLSVEEFRRALDEGTLGIVDSLRAIVASAHGGLAESIKWNAPSFALAGDDRITLGLERRGGVRVVIHRGARPTDAKTFTFDDPARLARWPAPDRGVIVFRDRAEVEARAEALRDLCTRWLAATS